MHQSLASSLECCNLHAHTITLNAKDSITQSSSKEQSTPSNDQRANHGSANGGKNRLDHDQNKNGKKGDGGKEAKKHNKDQPNSSAVVESNSYKKGRPANPESTKTIPKEDYEKSRDNIQQGKDISSEYPSYPGKVYEMPNGQRFGIRTDKQSRSKTETIDNMEKGSQKKWKKGD